MKRFAYYPGMKTSLQIDIDVEVNRYAFPVYSWEGVLVGGMERMWHDVLDVATDRLMEGSVVLDDRYYSDSTMISDIIQISIPRGESYSCSVS